MIGAQRPMAANWRSWIASPSTSGSFFADSQDEYDSRLLPDANLAVMRTANGMHMQHADAAGPEAWAVTARFALDAATSEEAQGLLQRVLSIIDVPLDGQPEITRLTDHVWSAEVRLDISGVPVFEPDNAKARLTYVTRSLGGVTWRVSQEEDLVGIFEWPHDPPRGHGILAHPAVRAALIRSAKESHA